MEGKQRNEEVPGLIYEVLKQSVLLPQYTCAPLACQGIISNTRNNRKEENLQL